MGLTETSSTVLDRYFLVDGGTGAVLDLREWVENIDALDNASLVALLPFYYGVLDQMSLWLKKEEILSGRFEYVEPLSFYRELFPVGTFERAGHQEDKKPNGIAMSISTDDDGNQTASTVLVTDGLEGIQNLQDTSFAFMSPIGYIGRSRAAKNARWIYALTYDLDGVDDLDRFNDVLFQQHGSCIAPKPTFTVNSGRGLHLYYQFKEPIPAYPNIQEALKKLKYALLPLVWNRYTSSDDNPQRQGIVQGFRIVGTHSRLGKNYPVTAYRTGPKVDIDYLLGFLGDKTRKECEKAFQPLQAETSLDVAKEKWPDWYNRVILGNGERKTWHVKRDLYDWWLRTCKDPTSGVVVGHRYFCCMALSVFAMKCDIEQEELTRDIMELVPLFNSLSNNPDETFTQDDALRAMDAYTDSYATFPRKDIESLTGIKMPPNKRNGQKQEWHLEDARTKKKNMKRRGQSFKNKEGRPPGSGTKERLIQEFAATHPDMNHSQIARELGVSRPTVIKWLRNDSQDGSQK